MSDILKVLNSLTDIAQMHYTTELAKSKQVAEINQRNAIAERNLQATKERDQMKMTYDNSVRENVELRKRIDDSLGRLAEYNIAVDSMKGLDEMLTSVGSGNLISGKMEEHQGDIRGYSTDFRDNENVQKGLDFALEHNSKVLQGLSVLEAKAQDSINKIGTGIEALGDDTFDRVLDLSDYIARSKKIGKEEANKLAIDMVNDMNKNTETFMANQEQKIYEQLTKGEITEPEYDSKYSMLINNPNEFIKESAIASMEKFYSLEGIGGKAIASQAPTMEESLNMLSSLSLKDARDAKYLQSLNMGGINKLERLDQDIRSLQTGFDRIGKLGEYYTDMFTYTDLSVKTDAKYYNSPERVSELKDQIETNLNNLVEEGAIDDMKAKEVAGHLVEKKDYKGLIELFRGNKKGNIPYKEYIDKKTYNKVFKTKGVEIDLAGFNNLGNLRDHQHLEDMLTMWEKLDDMQNIMSGNPSSSQQNFTMDNDMDVLNSQTEYYDQLFEEPKDSTNVNINK
tara:strand:- start:149 stop:1678 length:1530 start_codon:yes stop_codon:yes gene_type:complete